jgi:hypothetical protein
VGSTYETLLLPVYRMSHEKCVIFCVDGSKALVSLGPFVLLLKYVDLIAVYSCTSSFAPYAILTATNRKTLIITKDTRVLYDS